jgi:hypothetical protein
MANAKAIFQFTMAPAPVTAARMPVRAASPKQAPLRTDAPQIVVHVALVIKIVPNVGYHHTTG